MQRAPNEPLLNVKVLVNFAPQNSLSAALQPLDTSALVSILRSIVRDPRIGKFSIVAFNMQEQRVVYRQEDVDRIDFPALGAALNSLNLGTIDLKRLERKARRHRISDQSGPPGGDFHARRITRTPSYLPVLRSCWTPTCRKTR